MVARLLQPFRGDAGEISVAAPLERFGLQHREHAEEQLSYDRDGEVALRQLDEKHIAVLDCITKIGERIGVASLPLDLGRQPEEQRRLTDEVERDVREGNVLLENRRMTAPLGETMAEHEPVVAKSHEIIEG